MERRLILRGLFSGAIAGLLAFVFAKIFAEPQIDRAIDYEYGRYAAQEALDKAAGLPPAPPEMEPFSRGVQATIGVGVGVVALAIALGGIYAVVFTGAYGRLGAFRARVLALLLALGALLVTYLVPTIKYPANPPSIGHSDTIKQRTGLFLAMLFASLLLGALAIWVGRRLRDRLGSWNATLIAIACFVALIAVVMLVLPSLGHLAVNRANHGDHATETPGPLLDPNGRIVFPGFPADVLFSFRLASIGTQLVIWGGIGLLFGPLAERLLEPERRAPGRSGQSPQVPAEAATR